MKKLFLIIFLSIPFLTQCELNNSTSHHILLSIAGSCSNISLSSNIDPTEINIDLTQWEYEKEIILSNSSEIKYMITKKINDNSNFTAILFVDTEIIDSIVTSEYNKIFELSYIF